MIEKLNLKEGVYYIGTCRNTNVARWYKGKFIFIGLQFGNPYIETIDYYGDVKNASIDGFIPMEEIKIDVDEIISERISQDYKNSARNFYQNLNLKDLKGEIWKFIPGYERLYSVSNLGRVKKHDFLNDYEKIMCQNISGGYLVVGLTGYGFKRKTLRVHRLVAMTFKPTNDFSFEVNHINSIRTDNRESNLEWISHSDNSKHTYTSGSYKKKLSPEDIIEIKKMLREGNIQRDIAKKFNVGYSTISEINTNKKWVNIHPDILLRTKN